MAGTQSSVATLEGFFQTGDIPTQQQFYDWLASFSNLTDNNALDLTNPTVTAFAGGGQASATLITKRLNVLTTVASTGDSVKLPPALSGCEGWILNTQTNYADVFPSTGDNFTSLGANLAVALKGFYMIHFICYEDGVWEFQFLSNTGLPVPRVNVQGSTASIAPAISLYNVYELTSQAAGLSVNAITGVFGTGQEFTLIIQDNGTAQTLLFDASFVSGQFAIPASTVAGKRMIMKFVYDATAAFWFLVDYSVYTYGVALTRVYRALLTQTGTSAPTAVVLENTLGVVPSFSYVATGNYTLTATGVLTAGKMLARTQAALTGGYWCSCNTLSSPNTLQIQTFNNVGGGVNAVLSSTPIEIIIYP